MLQFNFPTTILYGEGALKECASRIKTLNYAKLLLVTDANLVKVGIVKKVTEIFQSLDIKFQLFDKVSPNPLEEDIELGAKLYKEANCDCIVALGGGSPIDAAKVIKIRVAHTEPLAKFDDSKGGDKYIVNPMPPLYAISTTAGTGSEVGRAGVIILKDSGTKTIIFHPQLLPNIAVLEPSLTTGLPSHITAATGIDAFTHCLEAWFVNSFHPMADGIALSGMELIIDNLDIVVKNGNALEARGKMLIAASMGATAFQKGLGMIHSMAHPLSSEFNVHHGLANALLLPASISFLEKSNLTSENKNKISTVLELFKKKDLHLAKPTLSETLKTWVESLGVKLGLSQYNMSSKDIDNLSHKAFKDPCHAQNMIIVTREDLQAVYTDSM